MPIHDWTRVDAGLFHDFHQDWTIELSRALNAGRLPPGYSALIEQRTGGPIPDVPTLPRGLSPYELEETTYARRGNRIRIQHWHGRVVAVIEIVSPGNKSNQNALRAFVRKASYLIREGIHLLVIDLFPPSERDPQGIHKAIWDQIEGHPFELPPDKPLAMAAYRAVPVIEAFIEPIAVGDDLLSMPIFLAEDAYIPAPLEETYRASWAAYPSDFKELLEPPST